MAITLATEQDGGAWNRFVTDRHGSVYHRWEWRGVLRQTYGYRPCYWMVHEENEITGIMPAWRNANPLRRRLVSMPFLDYGGPLALSDKVAEGLLREALAQCRREGRSLECRTDRPWLGALHDSDTFILDLSGGYEKIWAERFDKKVRNLVRKAHKNGVEVREERGGFVGEYYSMYLETMGRQDSIPHAQGLFENIVKGLGDKAHLYSARLQGQAIAGMLTFEFGGTLYIWGNVSKGEGLGYAPNNALYNHVIEKACRQGFGRADFGSTPLGSGNRKFKADWGGEMKPLYLKKDTVAQIDEQTSRRTIPRAWVRLVPRGLLGWTSGLFRYLY